MEGEAQGLKQREEKEDNNMRREEKGEKERKSKLQQARRWLEMIRG
jgi:hypothetical protein